MRKFGCGGTRECWWEARRNMEQKMTATQLLAQMVQLMQQYAGEEPGGNVPQGDDLLEQLKKENAELQSRLTKSQSDHELDKELIRLGCRSTVAAKALVEPQWNEGEQPLTATEMAERLLEEASYLFEKEERGYRPAAGKSGSSEEELKNMIRRGLRGEV